MNIPGQYFLQAHTAVNVFDEIQKLNTALCHYNEDLAAQGTTQLTEETFYSEKGQPQSPESLERAMITMPFKLLAQQNLRFLPQDADTYIRCLKYVEQHILATKLTPKNILQVVKKINSLLFPAFEGKYRQCLAIVYDTNIMPDIRNADTFRQLDRFFQKAENQPVYDTWKAKTRAKIWSTEFAANRKTLTLDKGDLQCLQKMADICPTHNQIPHLLNELKEVLKDTPSEECYDIAGRLHQIIVKTHPFVDGNGRTARIVMNVVLMQAGKDFLLFDTDANYTQAIAQNNFVSYIKDLADRQPACEKVVSLAIRALANGFR